MALSGRAGQNSQVLFVRWVETLSAGFGSTSLAGSQTHAARMPVQNVYTSSILPLDYERTVLNRDRHARDHRYMHPRLLSPRCH
jgi:hypothetical protein